MRIVQVPLYAAKFARLYRKYRSYTMIPQRAFIENLLLAKHAIDDPRLAEGAVIECGTWKGGMAAALVEIGGRQRKYCFFDSFEGLPPAEEMDGSSAKAWQADGSNANCRASIDDFRAAIRLSGNFSANIDVRPGFFERSFQSFDPPPIAILRLDADWYTSTMACLRKFWRYVLPGGIVLIDDYYTWDGCSRAVHDFLAEAKAEERIQQGRFAGVAYIKKRQSVQ